MMTQKHNQISSFDDMPLTAYVRQPTVEVLFACSSATVWRWVQRGFIPSPHKIGGATLWNVGELRDALNAVRGM